MQASELFQILWRRKLLVLVILGTIVMAAGWSLSTAPEKYEARSKVALLPNADIPSLVPFYGQAVDSLLPTYAEIVESIAFLDPVSDDLDFVSGPDELKAAVRAEPVSRVGVLDIVATSANPKQAQEMSLATAEALVERLEDNGVVTVTLLDEARVPSDPVVPSSTVVFSVAVFVGLLLGGTAAVVWDRFFGRLSDADDVAEATDLPVLSVLPEMRRMKPGTIVVGDPQLHALEEAFRSLRTNILFADRERVGGATIITGLSPADGKSTVAANLAVLTAELGISVLLIDADLHRPVQHEFFDVPNEIGLTSLIDWGTSTDKVIQDTGYDNLRIVTSGPPISSRSSELHIFLDSIRELEEQAEVVIVDSPPLRAGDEVRLLAAFARRTVLLVRAGASTPRQLQQALDSLKIVGGKVLGMVVTRADERKDVPEPYRYYRKESPGARPGGGRGTGPDGETFAKRAARRDPDPQSERESSAAPEIETTSSAPQPVSPSDFDRDDDTGGRDHRTVLTSRGRTPDDEPPSVPHRRETQAPRDAPAGTGEADDPPAASAGRDARPDVAEPKERSRKKPRPKRPPSPPSEERARPAPIEARAEPASELARELADAATQPDDDRSTAAPTAAGPDESSGARRVERANPTTEPSDTRSDDAGRGGARSRPVDDSFYEDLDVELDLGTPEGRAAARARAARSSKNDPGGRGR